MRPELQMKFPYHSTCTFTPKRISWECYVQEKFSDFLAPFAANEGIDAVIRYMTPGRRKLQVNRVNESSYLISSKEGTHLVLSQISEDSLILRLDGSCTADVSMELGYYDAADVANFIGHMFAEYRKHINNILL